MLVTFVYICVILYASCAVCVLETFGRGYPPFTAKPEYRGIKQLVNVTTRVVERKLNVCSTEVVFSITDEFRPRKCSLYRMNKSAVNSTDLGPDPKRLENNTIYIIYKKNNSVHFLLFNKQFFDLLFKVQRGSPEFVFSVNCFFLQM